MDNILRKFCVRIHRKPGFSLIEMVVVLGIISLLMAILMPSLSRARRQARAAVCQSNIRQIYLANVGYANENDGFYVRAAFDISSGFGGRHRWHGIRTANGVHPDQEKNFFDPLKGPLRNYLANGSVKQCPEIVKFVRDGAKNAFEAGCGGYGYNSIGVGSRSYKSSLGEDPMRSSMKVTEITRPGEKVMFTDTAFVRGFSKPYLIEYSFCEPPYNLSGRLSTPSIHFRHREITNVVWCDGHISGERFAFSTFSQQELEQFSIGWFGPKNNSLFRP